MPVERLHRSCWCTGGCIGVLTAALAGAALGADADRSRNVSFHRDVRPILAEHCWHCHGPDASAREADLRLDQAEEAHADRGGYRVIDVAHPSSSQLLQRISSSDPAEQMPPPAEQRQLTSAHKDVLRQWILSGGEYEPHWSLIPPRRPRIPAAIDDWPAENPIDRFVQARLPRTGLRPAPSASRENLIRRVNLDLLGLPPTPEDVEQFLNDDRPDAYERLVDRLLASARYGERMAMVWLDAARFADSGGYQGDILRSMWLWRDWVIRAYNANMPFDQFTIEQLAGDLLPHPTQDQLIATGFNRNHRINDEDGIIFEEFRVEYVADRVETTASVWLGLTARCARCHDHKYDPISQREYYQLFAFFNSIDEQGRGHGNAPPLLHVIPPEVQPELDRLDRQITQLRAEDDPEPDGERGTQSNEVEHLTKRREQLLASVPNVMIMRELGQPRPTHILIRGGYDHPGEEVIRGTPSAISPAFEGFRQDRLGMARWLVDPRNPLTARVAVNRYWQMYFGRGLVETPEDFGTQGSLPTHPELLDWLATEFVRTGWNVKSMQRLIVTSRTYRQAASVPGELWNLDSENRYLGRAPRFRLPAETIRDQALAAAGLLQDSLGGPSVRPYQPEGLWTELASASRDYEQSHGSDLYRSSLYSFVRRTVPLPSMTTLDAPNRELCVVRRQRTNTPLQALVLMNDETWVEAARVLAERTLWELPIGSGNDHSGDADRLRRVFRRLLVRSPTGVELDLLLTSLDHYRSRYAGHPDEAAQFIAVGEAPVLDGQDPIEVAALTAVCSLLMNLDETLTRE
jgi:hypothetical protein